MQEKGPARRAVEEVEPKAGGDDQGQEADHLRGVQRRAQHARLVGPDALEEEAADGSSVSQQGEAWPSRRAKGS